MVPVVSVVGKSGVGKTYVMTGLVAELKKRGHRVATVKHSAHKVDLDIEGKDSWQHAQAGSDIVVISSPHGFALIKTVEHDHTLGELSRFVGADVDIILAEGFKQDKVPKIEVHRKGLGTGLISARDELLAVATDEELHEDLPQYAPDDAAGLADLLEQRYLNKAGKDYVALYVNGTPVRLNDFVKGIFSNILLGMVASLKRVPKANDIDIALRRRSE
jgi:molybdopterin-guanine dinucleotide biosynthesis protein B